MTSPKLPTSQPLTLLPTTHVPPPTDHPVRMSFIQYDGVRLIREPTEDDRQRFQEMNGELLSHNDQWYLVYNERKGNVDVPASQIPDHLTMDGNFHVIRPDFQDPLTVEKLAFANLVVILSERSIWDSSTERFYTKVPIPTELRDFLYVSRFMYFCGKHLDLIMSVTLLDDES